MKAMLIITPGNFAIINSDTGKILYKARPFVWCDHLENRNEIIESLRAQGVQVNSYEAKT